MKMCGIFGFALTEPISMTKVLKVLEKLEVHQYPHELKPVGGYGAGLAVLKDDGTIILEKVGRIDEFPARCLSRIVKVREATVLVGHVRMPSPQFMETVWFKETAQPYVTKCYEGLTVVSIHNGSVTNYEGIRKKLSETHVLESEKVGFIDSEAIPHIFEDLLEEKQDVDEALYSLFCALQGSSAISLLQVNNGSAFLHFIHKGKTRGLTIWTNEQNELVFCSRKEPLIGEFGDIFSRGKFKERISIAYSEDAGLRLSYPLALRVKG